MNRTRKFNSDVDRELESWATIGDKQTVPPSPDTPHPLDDTLLLYESNEKQQHIKHNEIQIEIEMKTAKTDVCTSEDDGEWEEEEGENESVNDANNSRIIERPQNECAP